MLNPMHPDEFAALMEDELFNQRTARTLADLSPVEFAEQKLKILDRNKHIVPLRYNAAQRHYLENRGHRNLIVKARHLGLTTVIAAENFRKNVTSPASTFTLAHMNSTTQAIRRMVQKFWSNMPEHERPEIKYSNETITTYPALNSEALIATAGSPTTGRGVQSLTAIHGTEVAYWKDAQSILSGVMQAGDPQIDLESTANGYGNYFAELVMQAIDGDSDWKVFFYPWWMETSYRIRLEPDETIDYSDDEKKLIQDHGLTPEQIKFRRNKIRELTEPLFAQEYPESLLGAFRTSGTGVFGDFTHALYTPPEDDAWQDGHIYCAGCDFGQSSDYTVLSIIDVTENREVFLGRWRHESWESLRKHILDVCCDQWRVTELYPESNSIGRPNIEALEIEMREREHKADMIPFNMNSTRKAQMVAQLYAAIHEGETKFIDRDYSNNELRQFVQKQGQNNAWTYGGAGDTHDDTVIARAAACYAVARRI